MAWAKVDDGWWCHPKVLPLSKGARGVWISTLSWSCHQRRDTVPPSMVALVGGDDGDCAELVAAGLWVEAVDGFRIHGWAEYQDRSLSEKRAEAGAKGGRASKRKQSEVASEANGQAGPSRPFPSRPYPDSPSVSEMTNQAAPQPVDDEGRGEGSGFRVECWDLIARWRLDERKGAAGLEPVRDERRWLARAAQKAREEHEGAADEFLSHFDIRTPLELAEALTGKRERRSLVRKVVAS